MTAWLPVCVVLKSTFTWAGVPESRESGEPRSIFGDVARIVAYAGVGLTLSLIVRELNNGQSISFPFQSNKDDGERKTTKESSINIDILEPQGFVTERVYFDVSICGGPSERLVIINWMSALNYFKFLYYLFPNADWWLACMEKTVRSQLLIFQDFAKVLSFARLEWNE